MTIEALLEELVYLKALLVDSKLELTYLSVKLPDGTTIILK